MARFAAGPQRLASRQSANQRSPLRLVGVPQGVVDHAMLPGRLDPSELFEGMEWKLKLKDD